MYIALLVYFVLSLIVESLTHIALYRFVKMTFLKSLVGAYFIVFILSSIGFYILGKSYGLMLPDYLFFALLFSFYSYGYFHIINIGESSIRIRILNEIVKADGSLAKSKVLDTYNAQVIIQNRIERLVQNGQLRQQENKLFNHSPQLLTVAKIFQLLKWAIMGKGNYAKPYEKVDEVLK